MENKIIHLYRNVFHEEAHVFSSAPGRINLIGEHTDYNNGFVLPASINKRINAVFGKRSDSKIKMYSIEFDDFFEISIEDIHSRIYKGWISYILGVVFELKKTGRRIDGFNVVVGGDIPIGAGLSSSAAIECAVLEGLNELFDIKLEKLEMAEIAQKAEHNFAGVRCGIMDQFTSLFGKKDHVIKLDCQNLRYSYIPFELKEIKLVLFDTKVKHSLASSQYNIRREQCEEGISIISSQMPDVKSLRDITIEEINKYLSGLDQVVFNRCKYVVEENMRLIEACNDLERKDFVSFGNKMFKTHEGLKDLYSVSCDELDHLVGLAKGNQYVIGSRMMGGGFGGCTINLIQEDMYGQVVEFISKEYEAQFGYSPEPLEVLIDCGTYSISM